MSVNPVFPVVFQGGQLTDLPAFSGSFSGTEVMEIVAAPAGQSNAESGVNYQITMAQLGALLVGGGSVVIIQDGQYNLPGSPFTPGASIARIYINKVIAEPTYITFGLAANSLVDVLIKDVDGTVGIGNEVNVAFTGGETADGYATVQIQSAFGGYFFRPISALNKWTLGSP